MESVFYTDRQVDFDMLEAFTPGQIRRIAPMEHERWVREHQAMGWKKSDFYRQIPVPCNADEKSYRIMLREQRRGQRMAMDGELTQERILMNYQGFMSEYGREADYQAFNSILKLMLQFDGLRIYQFADD